jgi:hypothetical protein
VIAKAPFIEHEYVIQTLTSNRADHAFDVRPLPRRAWRSQDLFNPHRFDLINEVLPKDPVAIAQQITT